MINSPTWQQALNIEPTLGALQAQWSKRIRVATPVSGGLSNQCWKITTQCGQDYLWRPQSQLHTHFSTFPHHQYQVLTQLVEHLPCTACFTIPKVELLLPEGLLIEWLAGKTLPNSDKKNPHRVMASLAQLHQLPMDDFSQVTHFDYAQTLHQYWQATPKEWQQQQDKRYHFFINAQEQLMHRTLHITGEALCHCDLASYNIVVSSKEKWGVIDWEYARITSPVIDLTLSILADHLDIAQSIQIYSVWRQRDLRSWHELVQAWTPYLIFMMMVWYRVAETFYQRESDLKMVQNLDKWLTKNGF